MALGGVPELDAEALGLLVWRFGGIWIDVLIVARLLKWMKENLGVDER